MKCPESAGAGARCAGIGDKAACAVCANVVPDPDKNPTGLKPSASQCAELQLPDDTTNKIHNYCFYTQDPSVIIDDFTLIGESALIATTALLTAGTTTTVIAGFVLADHGEDVIAGSCAQMQIDCKKFSSC